MDVSPRLPYRVVKRGKEHVATRIEVKATNLDRGSDLRNLIHGVKVSRQSSLNRNGNETGSDDDWITVNLRVIPEKKTNRCSKRSSRYGK